MVVFSLIKDSVKSPRLVRYSLYEIKEIASVSNLDIIDIDSESEPTEYVVKCKIKSVKNEKRKTNIKAVIRLKSSQVTQAS